MPWHSSVIRKLSYFLKLQYLVLPFLNLGTSADFIPFRLFVLNLVSESCSSSFASGVFGAFETVGQRMNEGLGIGIAFLKAFDPPYRAMFSSGALSQNLPHTFRDPF